MPPVSESTPEPEPPPAPPVPDAPADRLLAAMQRIGYLEGQVEHWRAHAQGLEQRLAESAARPRWPWQKGAA